MSAKDLEFLTSEAVEGETLAERLAHGNMPEDEALRYAIEIGAALNRGHVRGLIHGKLSTNAVILTAAGARVLRPREGADRQALPYRAPEQVSGETADERSDVFSFGAILYEMASGRRAFAGEGLELDRAILKRPPAPLLGKSPVHAAMEGVIAHCLEKDPQRRRQRIQNAVNELKLAGRLMTRLAEFQAMVRRTRTESAQRDANKGRQRLTRFLLGLAFAAVAVGAWTAARYFQPRTTPARIQFSVAPNQTDATYRMPAISPDGRYLAIQSAGPQGKQMLWLRPLDALQLTLIPGTEGAFAAFWSPDSQSLAFFADQTLKRVRISGGPVEKVCDAEAPHGGGTWNRSGTILFAAGRNSTLYRVSPSGGEPVALTRLNPGNKERAHLWPQFLPDGKHFVFFVLSDLAAVSGVYSGALDSPDYRLLFLSQTNAVYSNSGSLLYIRDRHLVGVGFDAEGLQLRGAPATMQDDVGPVQSLSLALISISQNGTLVYQGAGPGTRQLAWMERSGRVLKLVAEAGNWGAPRISPDGAHAIVAKTGEDQKNTDLWMVDQAGNATRFISGPDRTGSPVWSPYGARIAYSSDRNGSYDLLVSPARAGAKGESVLQTVQAASPTDWSRDGSYLLFNVGPSDAMDLWAVSLADRHAGPLLDTGRSEGFAALSPDGKWLAFQSDESGRNQIYVQPFDGISNATKPRCDDLSKESGGGMPRWRADGKELFFMTSEGRMMSVNVHPHGAEFAHDRAQSLFQTETVPQTWNAYDVAPDGQRFLVNLPMEWSGASPITVITHWNQKPQE